MRSNFHSDLRKEQVLSSYLDTYYNSVFENTDYTLERVHDPGNQYKGIDLIVKNNEKEYFIDEKAQLDYLEEALPTFAFELSYYKGHNMKQGWLFDYSKETQFYFLVTAIKCRIPRKIFSGIKSVKVISVNRKLLLNYLCSIGLDKTRLEHYDYVLRKEGKFKNSIKELNSRTEGNIYYSEKKVEKPMNIVLFVQNLIDRNIAKEL